MPTKCWLQACWLGGGAWKRRDAERHAIGAFVAPRQEPLARIHWLIAREHLHDRPERRNLAHADATLSGNERTHLVLQSGDSREDFWRNVCGAEPYPVIMQVEEERFRQAVFLNYAGAGMFESAGGKERFGIMDELAGTDIYNQMRLW